MKLDPHAGLITLEVEVFRRAKSRIVRMALDTGATYVMVPFHVLEALGYAPRKARKKLSITTASGTKTAPLVSLDKLKAMGKTVAAVPAICHDLPRQSPVDGLLGLSFLKWFDVDLHFRTRTLRLSGPSRKLCSSSVSTTPFPPHRANPR
ncbi:MAG: TIGR02281 family clan AA aspartic protease [Limisphaerales bacterium]